MKLKGPLPCVVCDEELLTAGTDKGLVQRKQFENLGTLMYRK